MNAIPEVEKFIVLVLIAAAAVSFAHPLAIPLVIYMLIGFFKYTVPFMTPPFRRAGGAWGVIVLLMAPLIWPAIHFSDWRNTLTVGSDEVWYSAYLNDVVIGTVSERELSFMLDDAYSTPLLYVRQIINLVSAALKTGVVFLLTVPVIGFWLAFSGMHFAGDAVFALDVTVTGADVKTMITSVAVISSVVWGALALLAFLTTRYNFGFENQFDREVSHELKQKFGATSEGRVIVDQTHRLILGTTGVGRFRPHEAS